jgi:dTDP-4-amino-4,6-dideoxygalactose transaminase
MTTAEGGMLTTGLKEVADKVRMLSLHGLSTGAWARYSGKGSWEYDVLEPGYKYNLPDMLAAMGIAQLKKLNQFNSKRKRLASLYIKGLKKIPELRVPSIIEKTDPAWQIFPVILNVDRTRITRNLLMEELKQLNIGTSVHFKPVHLFSYYRDKFSYGEGSLKVSEDISKKILSLPLFPEMKEKDISYVLKSIEFIFNQKKYKV